MNNLTATFDAADNRPWRIVKSIQQTLTSMKATGTHFERRCYSQSLAGNDLTVPPPATLAILGEEMPSFHFPSILRIFKRKSREIHEAADFRAILPSMKKKAPTAEAEQTPATEIDPIASETIIVPVVGTAPLISHRFSEKEKRKMLDTMQGRKSPKKSKDPVAEFEAASYRLGDGYGVPCVAFKAATVSAARFYPKNDVTMTGLRQFMFFRGAIGIDGVMLVALEGEDGANGNDWPRMREDVVRVNRGGSDLRYRPEFWPWSAKLQVTYVTSALTRGSILSLIDAGGLGVGVSEWRPEKGGDFGTYRVDVEQEVEVIEA